MTNRLVERMYARKNGGLASRIPYDHKRAQERLVRTAKSVAEQVLPGVFEQNIGLLSDYIVRAIQMRGGIVGGSRETQEQKPEKQKEIPKRPFDDVQGMVDDIIANGYMG